ncbi:unnamed protein product [Paramecium pentaurelia]|uniref:Transmembrane protein n=1 Tax=Paramecium pentaurelia TaxID=43138 RepID=A0A8S1TFG9_9CILI|nr:unnamed protein product [Paramecium pentaurelia]
MILNEISRDDEQQSFVSLNNRDLSAQTQTNLKQQITYLPPMYASISFIVLFAAILSQLQYPRAQTFPLFLELPFQKNQLFTIGNALMSLIGILIYYLIYQTNQKISQKLRFNSRYEHFKPFSFQIFLSGVSAHLSFLAFALLPIEQKNQANFLYTEDRILLTFSFLMNFLYTSYYMCYKQSSQKQKIPNQLKEYSLSQQIKAALFTVICFLFTAFVSVNFISLFMGMPMAQGEPNLNDGLSASEDFIANMVSEIYSTLSYSLYLMNSLFIGMFYTDFKKINLIMIIDQEIVLSRNQKSI